MGINKLQRHFTLKKPMDFLEEIYIFLYIYVKKTSKLNIKWL
jgi:hypothetical protein